MNCRRPARVALGLAALCLSFAGGTGAAIAAPKPPPSPPLDTVTATGSSEVFTIPGLHFPVTIHDINITAQSGAAGENASGSVSFAIGELAVSGTVTCLRVTGPDQGAGTPTAPTTAVLQFLAFGFIPDVLELVDKGGNGADLMTEGAPPSTTDCPAPIGGAISGIRLTEGRAVVFDAPPLPTSKEQCRNGGWQQFGFKNQGQCVAFVEHRPPTP
jgi:FlaG/FlaF family flagellin (archaellin)